MKNIELRLQQDLNQRKEEGKLRSLKAMEGMVDLTSNDYLGLANSNVLKAKIKSLEASHPGLANGAGGSRLLSGNYHLIQEVETDIAAFHVAESGLIFNSGYDANVGLMATVPKRNDTILYDERVHASIRDGIRLSFANAFSFNHNDLEDLEKKLNRSKGEVFIMIESLYSMDGDLAPLEAMVNLSRDHNCFLVVDEAHANGIIGHQGEGLVKHLNLQNDVLARVHTFGKAVGVHGAIVLGSQTLVDYLVNFCRSFIYTTAPPPAHVLGIKAAYQTFPEMTLERSHLVELKSHFHDLFSDLQEIMLIKGDGPIQGFKIPGNWEARKMAEALQNEGFDVRPVLSPTVPQGQERIRICLHAYNTKQEIQNLKRAVRASIFQ